MNKTEILSALDEEISRLRQARDLLADTSLPMRGASAEKSPSGSTKESPVKRGPGRPKGSGSKSPAASSPAKKSPGRPAGKSVNLSATETPQRRTMSAEGKARIAEAQRARWARQHDEAGEKGAPAKKSGAKKSASKAAGAKAGSKKEPVKAAKTVKKAPVKARGPYKKSAAKASAKPAAAESAAQVPEAAEVE